MNAVIPYEKVNDINHTNLFNIRRGKDASKMSIRISSLKRTSERKH